MHTAIKTKVINIEPFPVLIFQIFEKKITEASFFILEQGKEINQFYINRLSGSKTVDQTKITLNERYSFSVQKFCTMRTIR